MVTIMDAADPHSSAQVNFNWKIAGQAGGGITISEAAFAKICIRHGLHVCSYAEYPSLIRGGHTTGQVHASSEAVHCQQRIVDVMVALNEDAVSQHLDECGPSTIVMVDKAVKKLIGTDTHCTVLDLPMHALSIEATGSSLADNMVALGASCYLLGLHLEIAIQLIRESFQRKGSEVAEKNAAALKKGYEFVRDQKIPTQPTVPPIPSNEIFLSGNEAVGLGALAAGVQFYAAYPMTPTSTLLTFLAKHQDDYPILVKHAEDEISAINQAIGASFAGVRAMVGTSGGGFALMVEACSLAGITETPLVVVEGQRPGPATGLPTWTCQADLQFVLHAGHGEFPKVVLAPGDVSECFQMTQLAVMIAEKYQTQVYILGDKYLLESSQSVARFADTYTHQRYSMISEQLSADNSYQRYAITESGYTPRSIPGQPHGVQLSNSYEHDEHGYATEDAKTSAAMVEKRLRKIPAFANMTPLPVQIGPNDTEITFITWGSTKLVIEEVLRQLNTKKAGTANAIHLSTMMPFHADEFLVLAKQAKRLVMMEGNATHQCESLIREHTGLEIHERINRYDGRPFYTEDIVQWVDSAAKGTV